MNSSNESIQQLATLSNRELLGILQSDAKEGLTGSEVDKRQQQYGPNDIIQQQRTSLLQIILNQFTNPIAWLLLIAVLISLIFQDYLEMYAIIAVLFINAAIGAITEFKALHSMEALRKMSEAHAIVLRNGKKITINASELVPGDIVLLTAGDLITADMCLLDSNKLQADESPLTGESLPIAKSHTPTKLSEDIQNSRTLYKGTAVLRGTATAVVVNTGTHTELGKISTLISEAAPERSPLEERIQQLSGQLIKLTLGLIVVITILGLIKAESYLELVKTSIALAVAAIPEGMLIVTTLVLARSMLKLAQKNVLIERLSAVETLGSTTLIMTDKTGTLTENKMLVTEVLIEVSELVELDKTASATEHSTLAKLMEIAVLCNNADDEQESGDPIELALLKMASSSIPKPVEFLEQFKKVAELPFDPDIRLMVVSHEVAKNNHCQASIKGAPESIIEHCSHFLKDNEQIALTESLKNQWLANVNQMAESGLRVLALGYRLDNEATTEIANNFCLVGVVGMEDPLRETVPEAIEQCHNAGIRIIMVTGDNGLTANKIAQKAQLVKSGKDCHTMTGIELKALTEGNAADKNDELYDVDVFSRVSPRQKYDLAEFYQSRDHVVAMTGDGVNDGPALKNADIGIAMGIRGTEVAKQAADMVLLDDSFPAIAEAIAQGRSVFNNIRKFVLYLLSCNLSEILVVSVAVLSGFPIPLLPLQILFLNLVTDVFPALALGACKGEAEEMEKPPREQSERIIETKHWQKIIFHALFLTTLVFSAFLIDLYYFESTSDHAVTVAFLTLAISQLLHVFNMREENKSFWKNEVIRNAYVWIALGICTALILAAIYVPLLSRVLNIVEVDTASWLLVLGFSSMSFFIYSLTNLLGRFIRSR